MGAPTWPDRPATRQPRRATRPVGATDTTGVADMAQQWKRPSYNLAPEHIEALATVADIRCGGNKSLALRHCVALGQLVLTDPATFGVPDVAEALARYVRAHADDQGGDP